MALVLLTFMLVGCADVMDAANPVEWYKNARDALTGEGDKTGEDVGPNNRLAADRDKPAPGANESAPSLSTVPARPVRQARFDRDSISTGLVADRESARRYSKEVIRRQGEATKGPRPAPMLAPSPAPAKAETLAEAGSPVQQVAAPKPVPDPVPVPRLKPVKSTAQARPAAGPKPLPVIDIPDESPNAPQLAVVRPYIPPRGVFDLGTVIISGSGQVNTRGIAAPPAVKPQFESVALERPILPPPPASASGSYQVATIQFPNGSAKIGSRERRILRQVAAQHKKTGGTIRVVGHASSRTRSSDVARHKLINLRVSAARADSIARELVKFGTKASDISIGAVSDSEPKYHEYMPSGEAGNRRAEIFFDF